MKKKIPPDLEAEILRLHGANNSADEIAAWLANAHSVEISGRGVRRWLEDKRKEREPIARAAIAKAVSETVTTDLDELGTLITRARSMFGMALHKGNIFASLKAITVEQSLRETRLKLSGGVPDSGGDGAPRAVTAVILLPAEKPIDVPKLPPPAKANGPQ